MTKKLGYGLLIIFGIFFLGIYLISGFPLVINQSTVSNTLVSSDSLKKGEIIEPLKNQDFNSNNCSAYLILSKNDLNDLPNSIRRAKVLVNKDRNILQRLKNDFKFVYSGGDMATCESFIYIFINNKLVFKSSIVLEENKVGLQNEYGWIEAQNSRKLIEIMESFEPVYLPVIFL
jgi:hypothetical protein